MDFADPLGLAERLLSAGDEAAALAAYEQAAREARARFDPLTEACAKLGTGDVHRLAGNDEAARAAYEEAAQRAVEGGSVLVEADAHFALALTAFDAGRSKDGHDALLEAMELYRREPGDAAKSRLARSVRLYGEHLTVLGNAVEANRALELARSIYRELGDAGAAASVDEDLKRIEADRRRAVATNPTAPR